MGIGVACELHQEYAYIYSTWIWSVCIPFWARYLWNLLHFLLNTPCKYNWMRSFVSMAVVTEFRGRPSVRLSVCVTAFPTLDWPVEGGSGLRVKVQTGGICSASLFTKFTRRPVVYGSEHSGNTTMSLETSPCKGAHGGLLWVLFQVLIDHGEIVQPVLVGPH